MSKGSYEDRIKRIEAGIGAFPDFPQKGILFRDIFPLMKDPTLFADCCSLMSEHIQASHGSVDVIVGLEARGFLFGPFIAQQLNCAFVPVRKAGKLPGATLKIEYQLEYGTDVFEVQEGSIQEGQRVVIVDDLLATGGTMSAAHQLMTKNKANVVECMVLIEMVRLKGRNKVNCAVKSFVVFHAD